MTKKRNACLAYRNTLESSFKSIAVDDDKSSWSEGTSINAMEDTNIQSKRLTTAPINTFEIARQKSKNLASKIEKDDEKAKNIQIILACLCLVIALIAGSINAFILLIKNGEKKYLQCVVKNSNYIPLFLYVPGTTASVIPSALSSVLQI